MHSLRLFILILTLQSSNATQSTRRSLNNIFNRTKTKGRDNVTATSPISNTTSQGLLEQQNEVNITVVKNWDAINERILPQRFRRLGVGARIKSPSDNFIEGNENMHRFFDKMLMSMKTEIPTNSPAIAIPAPTPTIPPTKNPAMLQTPTLAPMVSTVAPSNTTQTLSPVILFVCDPPITIAKREELILSILNDITPESVILTTGTSQNKAFNWLINIDELNLCPSRTIDIIQRYILAVTYFSLGGDDWYRCSAPANTNDTTACVDQDRYLSKANVCDWFNVTCSIDGNITGLILDDNNLVGLLPDELQALDRLVNISFYNNTMVSGSLPSSYGSLPELKRFDVSNNVIMGTIPATICNASSLQQINFRMNILAGTIPTCIGSISSLRSIDLDRNLLTGTIPTHISRLSLLETLSISDNILTGIIPVTVGRNEALRELSLQQNSISGSVPTSVGSLTNLESLNLFFNKLRGTIPTELGNLNRLEILFLHFNDLTGTMPSTICDLRDTNNGTLRQLTSDCGIRGKVICPLDCCTACF